ncbi:MAG: hypothetical protein QOI74_1936 [Micromonosporaceae bacterium]|nr:hypothetical protein [Micromonosporaceae bacterium]
MTRATAAVRRWAPYLLASLAAAVGGFSLVPRSASGAPDHGVDYVIIAGAAGLRWDDVNATDTPALWRLATDGSIGALSVRSAHQPTCPGDGWLTLGAGNLAARTHGRVPDACPPLDVGLDQPGSGGAFLSGPEKQRIVSENQELPWGAQPGALAESMRCTTTVGPGAALAAARPFGRIDRYADAVPDDARALLAGCVLAVVDLGTVAPGDTGAVDRGATARRAAARAADARLATLVAARPDRSLIIVAGVSDTAADARLHVAIADGPGYHGGLLTSASTGRRGYVQLTDIAPTTLAALGRSVPTKLFPGAVIASVTGRRTPLAAALRSQVDADLEVRVQRPVASAFFEFLAFGQLALFVAAIPLLRRARRPAGPLTAPPNPRWYRRGVEWLLVAASLGVPAALLAGLVPWWRTALPGALFGLVTVAVIGAVTVAVTMSRFGRRVLWPLGGVAALGAVVVAVDLITGSRLQLNSVVGYSAVTGVQYAGLATVGLGVFTAGVLVGAGCAAQRVPRPWRPVVVAVIGGVAVILAGSPYLGADAAGAVALTAGVCVAAAMSTGGWLTFPRVAWALMAGIAVTAAFAMLDVSRPVSQRGSVGRFLGHLSDGTGRLVIHPIESDNAVVAATSPLTLLVLGSGAMLFFALLRPWGGLRRLFGLYPAVRAGLAGTAVATLVAGPMEGVGFNVAGGAAASVLPLTVLAALRVLRHADERTPAVTVDPSEPDRVPAPEPAPRVRPEPPSRPDQAASVVDAGVSPPPGQRAPTATTPA